RCKGCGDNSFSNYKKSTSPTVFLSFFLHKETVLETMTQQMIWYNKYMGELNVEEVDHPKLRDFMRALIADCWAIEKMLETGMMESGVRRIGAEQEMFLVDRGNMRPAMISSPLLQVIKDPHFTTELAKFNLEANLAP